MSSLVIQRECGCVEIHWSDPYICTIQPHLRSILSKGSEYTYCFRHSMLKRWPAECWKDDPDRVELDCGCVLYEHHNKLCQACASAERKRDERRRAYKRDQRPPKIQWVYEKKA